MSMEGINWGEVNGQVNALLERLSAFGNDVSTNITNFLDEMAYYWASGNAVYFGDYVIRDTTDFNTDLLQKESEIAELIKHAAEIYSREFNVPNEINIVYPLENVFLGNNPFKETVNGITGMNKSAADDCYEKYEAKIEQLIDDTKTYIDGVHISIMDAASAQSEAFSEKINRMFAVVNGILAKALQDIEKGKQEEKDRVDLAKQQTVSTFNA